MFDGILALPVISIPAWILEVSDIGISVSWFAVTAFVFTVILPKSTATSCELVAS